MDTVHWAALAATIALLVIATFWGRSWNWRAAAALAGAFIWLMARNTGDDLGILPRLTNGWSTLIGLMIVIGVLSIVIGLPSRWSALIGFTTLGVAILAPFQIEDWRQWVLVAIVTMLLVSVILLMLKHRGLAAMVVALATLTMVGGWAVSLMVGPQAPRVNAHVSVETADDPAPISWVAASVCPERFVQMPDQNEKHRFISDGLSGTTIEKRRLLLESLASDWRYLDFFAERMFDRQVDASDLLSDDRECLTGKGRLLYERVKGALLSSTAHSGPAPGNWFNTGVHEGQAVVARNRGIRGDRSATIFDLGNGNRMIVLDRCGNIVLIGKPLDLFNGPTDNPPAQRLERKHPAEHPVGNDGNPAATVTEAPSPPDASPVPTPTDANTGDTDAPDW